MPPTRPPVFGRTPWTTGRTWSALPEVGPDRALYLDATAWLRFAPADGFSGQPGQLTLRLVESLPYQAPYQPGDWPVWAGGTHYDLTTTDGPNAVAALNRGYSQGTVNLAVTVLPGREQERPSPTPTDSQWSMDQTGHIQEQSHHPSGYPYWRDVERETIEFPTYLREGLDSPQFRTSQGGIVATDTIITDTHIGSVIRNGNLILVDSIGRGLDQLSPNDSVFSPAETSGPAPHHWVLNPAAGSETGGLSLPLSGLNFLRLSGPAASFEVVAAGGGNLPAWLEYDSERKSLRILDHSLPDQEYLLRVLATDSEGVVDFIDILITSEATPPAGEAADNPDQGDDQAEQALDRAEEALENAALSFRELLHTWDRPETADQYAGSRPTHDPDLDHKLAQMPDTSGSLMRAANTLMVSLLRG